jgi:lipoprotein-anchoring transpeptidase ErfK/SrfK
MKRYIGFHYINHPSRLFFTLALLVGGVLGITYSVQAYPEFFKTEVVIGNITEIRLDEPMIVRFSSPVFQDAYADLRVIDKESPAGQAEKVILSWDETGRKLTIKPQAFWKPESQYEAILPDGRNKMLAKVSGRFFEFSTIKFPQVKNIVPGDGEKDVVLGIEDPIVVDFDKTTKDFFVKFDLDPASNLTYQNNPEKTQFKLLPSDKIKEGADYRIKISIKYEKDSDQNFKEIYASSFSTKPPAPQNWEKDFSLRIEQAKSYTPAQITTDKYIDINLAQQVLCIFENGKVVDCYMISTGKRGMETTKGQFAIKNKAPRVWSKRYGLYMPYWMAVASDGSFGIHELPEWPGGYKEGANHLGTPVSHGCIRLGVGPAKIVYDWTEIGTPVIIH